MLGSWDDSVAAELLRGDLDQDSPAHAYLLAGPTSEQKERMTELFIRGLLCQGPLINGLYCGHCDSCKAWERGVHPDYHLLQPEGSSIKIREIRAWHSFFQHSPGLGRHQIFSLEETDLLTIPAANSLLKVLEEPLFRTVFLLVTAKESLVLKTIISRCRVVLFKKAGEPQAVTADSSAKFISLLKGGTPGELLKEVRQLGNDRLMAQGLLEGIADQLEQDYRSSRESYRGLATANSLELLFKGIQQLRDNGSVPSILAVTLYNLQKNREYIKV